MYNIIFRSYITCCIYLHKVLILLSIITCVLSSLPHLFVLGIIMAYSNFKITPQLSMVIWPLHYMIRVYIVCKAASIASNEVSTNTFLFILYDFIYPHLPILTTHTYFMRTLWTVCVLFHIFTVIHIRPDGQKLFSTLRFTNIWQTTKKTELSINIIISCSIIKINYHSSIKEIKMHLCILKVSGLI